MKYQHECYEWDGMLIDEHCDEITACGCFDDEEFKKIKQTKSNEYFDFLIRQENNMLPSNRLDFIKQIDQEYIDMMTELRKEFIALDEKLRILGSMDNAKRDGVGRCLSLARTNIETGLQYAIKALCLMGEQE